MGCPDKQKLTDNFTIRFSSGWLGCMLLEWLTQLSQKQWLGPALENTDTNFEIFTSILW